MNKSSNQVKIGGNVSKCKIWMKTGYGNFGKCDAQTYYIQYKRHDISIQYDWTEKSTQKNGDNYLRQQETIYYEE